MQWKVCTPDRPPIAGCVNGVMPARRTTAAPGWVPPSFLSMVEGYFLPLPGCVAASVKAWMEPVYEVTALTRPTTPTVQVPGSG